MLSFELSTNSGRSENPVYMNKFTSHIGQPVAIFQSNIDTDQIIPKQFLKSIERSGFGQYLFYDWRFDSDGVENKEFILNHDRFKYATILIAGRNFGCGSSREHAPWSLEDYGFRVVIAPSFADIFYNNCFKIGLLPVVLDEKVVTKLVEQSNRIENYQIKVDLEYCRLSDTSGFETGFVVDNFRRNCLLNGLDEIGLTLLHETEITGFENRRVKYL